MTGVLDQIAEEGGLWLLLTGGEPLLRSDFPDDTKQIVRDAVNGKYPAPPPAAPPA